jgi:cbb3-type cytochrome oxidase maturation protein
MNIILVLIPLSLVLLAAGVGAFFWGVNNAQFDDLDTPGLMPLSDDPPPARETDFADST